MPFLKVSAISKTEGSFHLQKISFTQKKGEKIAIAGETGSGKSTLLKIIAGLVQPDEGQVVFENSNVVGPDDRLVAGHPEIAYLSQHFELQKFLRVEQVLEYANNLSEEEAAGLYRLCQIDHLVKRRTDQLSGGERQRIALATLLIRSPKLLLLDEPFAHLDMAHKITLKSVIEDITRQLKMTCILVSHDPQDTLSWADKILVLRDGKMIQKGTPAEVYNFPKNEYVGGLFGTFNVIPSSCTDLLKAFGLKPLRRKSYFLRPEKIILKKDARCRGTVTNSNDFGGYCETIVQLQDMSLLVRTMKKIKDGKKVSLSLPSRKVWTVPIRSV
jgi:ABC-type sulfate/molybdate transport systems ATPase subunit